MPECLPQAAGHGVQRNHLLSRALEAFYRGDLQDAQRVLAAAGEGVPTLDEVFDLYRGELEAREQQLLDSHLQLEQALDWFSNLFRTLPVAAVLLDRHGCIVDANAKALEDYMLAEVLRTLPMPLRRLLATAADEVMLASLLERLKPGHTEGLDDVAMRTTGGHPRWGDLRITHLSPGRGRTDPDGRTPLILCVVNDRTSRVQAEHALEEVARAQHQRDLAQSASRAKSELLARVSHELRTPLNAVLGFSALLLQQPERLDADASHKLTMISNAGHQLLTLVDEVLDINCAESGRLSLAREVVDLNLMCEEARAMLWPAADAAGVHLLPLAADTDGAWAMADGSRVREVLYNLVSNAIKYHRADGWVSLRLSVEPSRVSVEVSDNGIGMCEAQLQHLFEPFNRLGADRTRVPGSGLGLSISRLLAQAMGGTLSANSLAGVGSTFVLTLPRTQPPGT